MHSVSGPDADAGEGGSHQVSDRYDGLSGRDSQFGVDSPAVYVTQADRSLRQGVGQNNRSVFYPSRVRA